MGLDVSSWPIADLVEEVSNVSYISVSNWQAWKMVHSRGSPRRRISYRFETVQAYDSIASRDAEREIAPLVGGLEEEDGVDNAGSSQIFSASCAAKNSVTTRRRAGINLRRGQTRLMSRLATMKVSRTVTMSGC